MLDVSARAHSNVACSFHSLLCITVASQPQRCRRFADYTAYFGKWVSSARYTSILPVLMSLNNFYSGANLSPYLAASAPRLLREAAPAHEQRVRRAIWVRAILFWGSVPTCNSCRHASPPGTISVVRTTGTTPAAAGSTGTETTPLRLQKMEPTLRTCLGRLLRSLSPKCLRKTPRGIFTCHFNLCTRHWKRRRRISLSTMTSVAV